MGTAARRTRNSVNMQLENPNFFSATASEYIKCMFLNLDCVFTCLVRLHLTFYWREVLIHNLMEELRFLQGNVPKNTSNSLFPRNLGSLSACFLHSKMFAQTTKYVCTFLFIIFFLLNQSQRNVHRVQATGRWSLPQFSKLHENGTAERRSMHLARWIPPPVLLEGGNWVNWLQLVLSKTSSSNC